MQNKVIEEVALKLNLPYRYVWEVYNGYWKYVRHHLTSLPLKENISEEDFAKLRTSVNVPSLGKFYIEWEHLKNKKAENERYKNKRNKTPVHDSNNDS